MEEHDPTSERIPAGSVVSDESNAVATRFDALLNSLERFSAITSRDPDDRWQIEEFLHDGRDLCAGEVDLRDVARFSTSVLSIFRAPAGLSGYAPQYGNAHLDWIDEYEQARDDVYQSAQALRTALRCRLEPKLRPKSARFRFLRLRASIVLFVVLGLVLDSAYSVHRRNLVLRKLNTAGAYGVRPFRDRSEEPAWYASRHITKPRQSFPVMRYLFGAEPVLLVGLPAGSDPQLIADVQAFFPEAVLMLGDRQVPESN